MASVLDKRLVFVTGKGGTGKSTVAAALALAAARREKRVILCEVAQQRRAASILGSTPPAEAGLDEVEVAPGVAAISIDPQLALEEYLRVQVGNRALFRLLFDNRIFGYFAAAAPGAKELVTLGKIWELAQLERPWTGRAERYDLVVVDAPATGHGLALLRTPRTFREVARVGPIRRQADRIDAFVRDPRRTGVVAVALPEEMPVSETIDLRRRLTDDVGLELAGVIVNGLYPERFSGADAKALTGAARRPGLSAGARAAIGAALSEHRRARLQRAQLRRLRAEVGGAVALPYLFTPQLGLDAVERLSRELERRL